MRITPPIYNYTGLISGLGLAALLIGFVIMVVNPGISFAGWIIIALGAALLIIAIVVDFRKVKSAVTGKRGRFGAGTTVMVSVFLGITLLINAISINYNKRFDITELSQFTLTSQTKDVLTEMTVPVEAVCFFTPNDASGLGSYAQNLLEEYQKYTDLLTIKIIDPDEHPDVARDYSIEMYGTIAFESEIGRRSVTPEDMIITSGGEIAGIEMENPFTSAILEVTGVVQKKVYFLTGHGEPGISTTGRYAYAAIALKDNLFKVETLDLMTTREIPEDCTVLVIAAPQSSLNSLEYDIIREYLENKGWLIILINPGSTDDIKEFIGEWWIDIEEGIIIDYSAYYSSPDKPLIPRTQNYFGSYGLSETYYPGAVSLIPKEDYPDEILMVPLLYTSTVSWVEKDFDPTVEPEFNEGLETLGSRAIGIWILKAPPEEELDEEGNIPEGTKLTQLVIVGDSDFAANENFYNAYNDYQFLYLIANITTGEQIIKIERKVLPYRSLIIEPEEKTFIQVSSIGLLPLLVLIAGGIIWWRRR